MGCVASSIGKEERVRTCKERKRLMKQLLSHRKDFSDAQLGYLRALKNTGVTLRQFTESESLEPEDIPFKPVMPPSPPPPLPPSPPPPPTFSPDLRNFNNKKIQKPSEEEVIEIDNDSINTPPPPPLPSSSWDMWDPFVSSSPPCGRKNVEKDDDESFLETTSQFLDEDEEGEVIGVSALNVVSEKKESIEFMDDTSSMMSWHTKDTSDMAMVVWRNKKSLPGIIRELDDYFLNASACGKDVSILMDINVGDFVYQIKENKRKRYKSAKVFGALTWNWSSKSLQSTKCSGEHFSSNEPCKPGAHCITLEKIYAEEHRLYKLVKEEEIAKLEHEKKSFLLHKQEGQELDWTKTEKTRSVIEDLQSQISLLQESITRTCSNLLNLINEELHPQMIALTSGLMHMWKTMYECHQVQNYISQQLAHINDQQNVDPTTEYHRQAASQLKTEVSFWYSNFCKLLKAQREYVQAMCRWSQLTDNIVDDGQTRTGPSLVHTLSQQWLLALDKLPDKMASEAIKTVLSAVHSIILQQDQEVHQKKRSDKLEKKLQRELNSLAEMEMKFAGSLINEDGSSILTSKHPLYIKRAKVEVLKEQTDNEKAKYSNLIKVTRAMILNNLQTSLPNVFRTLMGFSSTYAQAFESVLSCATSVEHDDGSNHVL